MPIWIQELLNKSWRENPWPEQFKLLSSPKLSFKMLIVKQLKHVLKCKFSNPRVAQTKASKWIPRPDQFKLLLSQALLIQQINGRTVYLMCRTNYIRQIRISSMWKKEVGRKAQKGSVQQTPCSQKLYYNFHSRKNQAENKYHSRQIITKPLMMSQPLKWKCMGYWWCHPYYCNSASYIYKVSCPCANICKVQKSFGWVIY